MKRRFKTEKEAKKAFKVIHKEAIREIKKRGEKILSDSSGIYYDCISSSEEKYCIRMAIWTDAMAEDIKNFTQIDVISELEKELKKYES